jgi:four helix bundle protein
VCDERVRPALKGQHSRREHEYDSGMRTIRSYRDLIVWQKAMDLAQQALSFTHAVRHPRDFALADQIRRAAISVPANIAEGYGRRSAGDYRRFVSIANGSTRELETLLLLFARVDPSRAPGVKATLSIADEVCRMLTALHRRLGRPLSS